MNQEQANLLRQAVEKIEEHPDEFDMGYWVEHGKSWCGTVGCLAYNILRAKGYPGQALLARGNAFVERQARMELNALGSNIDTLDTSSLFHVSSWPTEAREQYRTHSLKEAAKNVVELFIAGDGSFNPPPQAKKAEEVLQENTSQPNYLDTGENTELSP